MAKISTYPEIVSPVVTDLLIGTDVSNSNATKNFTVQSIVDLAAFNAQDLQSVLDAGNSATENLTLIGTGTFTNISVTSNATITANLTAQGDVALGVLTTSLVPKLDNTYNLGSTTLHWGSLFIDGQVSGDSVIIDTGLVGATNFNIASTLSIKTYVDNQVGGVDTLSELLAKNPSPLTNPSNTTGGTDIVVSANDDITLTDSSKIKLSGTSLQIYSTGSGNSFIKGPTSGNLNITSDILILSKSNGDYMLSHGGEGVSIYYRGSTTPGVKLLTTSAGISVTGVGTFNTDEFNSIIVNSATTPSILLHNVDNSYYWRTIASGNGLLNFDLSTSSPTANFSSKLSLGANLVIVGTPSVVLGNNISSLTEVRGDLEVDGTLTATSIIGPVTGNAETATRLNVDTTSAIITISGGATGTAANTYRAGADVNVPITLVDTAVQASTLSSFNASAGIVGSGDSLKTALEKLQGTITNLPSGLNYISDWDASGGGGGSPDLTVAATHIPGHYYICSSPSPVGGTFPNGSTNLPSEWKIGDWCIRGDDTLPATERWQKIDNTSSIDGQGANNVLTKWTGTSSVGQSSITDDASTVTIANTVDLIVNGSTTLGNASTDTISLLGNIVGNATFSNNIIVTGKGTSASTITTDGGTTLTTKDYVDSVITAQELNFSGTSGTGSVDLDSQTFAVVGTANEIETSAGSQQLQIGLPTNVTIGGAITVGDDVIVSGNITLVDKTTSEVGSILLGGGNDLQIFHDGSNSFVSDSGTGDLILRSNSTAIIKSDTTKIQAFGSSTDFVTINSTSATFAGTITSGALSVGSSGTSRFTDTNAFPLQLNRGLDVDSVGSNGAILGIGTIKNGTYKDGIRISGGLEVNGTDGTFTLQTLGGGSYTNALTIDSSQNATFAGNVTGGNGSFTNLTINAGEKLRFDGAGGHTFIQEVSNDNLIFATGGTTRLTLDSNATFEGSVSIDANSGILTQEILKVKGGGSGGAYGFLVEANNGDDLFKVDTSTYNCYFPSSFTKVGIGTGGYAQKTLDISGASGGQLLITSADDSVGSSAGILLRAESGEANGLARIKGGIFFERIAGSFGNGDLKFAVNTSVNNDAVTVADTKMTIDSSGNVGIGDDTPTSKLTVLGTSTAASNTPSNAIFDIQGTSTAHLLMGVANVSPFGAWINTDGTGQPLVLMGTGGNVGIGTATPIQTLQVHNPSNSYNQSSIIRMGTETTNNFAAEIGFFRGTSSDADRGLFLNATGSGQSSQQIKLLLNGNVGIGTATPDNILHIETSNAGGPQIQLESTSGTASAAFINFDSTSLQLSTQRDMVDGDWYDTSKSWGGINIQGPAGGSFITFHTAAASNTSPTERMRITSGGQVNIGQGTSITGYLNIEQSGNHIHLRNGGAASGKYWNFDVASNNRLYILNNGDTGVYIADGATSWTANSDESLKENIKPLNNVLDKIKDYRCVEYNFKSDKLKDKKIGFIAQDWENDFAPIVNKDEEGLLGMKYTETIPVLLKAIQELKAKVDMLEKNCNCK